MASNDLTLFFNDADGNPRVDDGLYRRDLDPETAPQLDEDGNALWIIGRGKHADIVFDSLAVSRRHAYIRCWAVESRSVWQIKHDLNARNPSWKDNRDGEIRLPDQWLNIHDYDQFWFATKGCGFICTTSPNDTMQCEADTEVDDGPPTINETMERAIAEHEAHQASHPWYAELVQVVIDGPKGFPQWLWWLCLMGAGLFVAWLKNRGD
jgi:hypothetical protein